LSAQFPQAEIASHQLRRLARKRNLAIRVRQNNTTGKSLLIFRNRVKGRNQKYSSRRVGQITFTTPPVSPDERGGSRVVTKRAVGCGGREACD